ncbi:MAG: hypothetical protein H6908_03500 [Hyphomicrobiales bacterium]|nr:hypothetical protein [Rickettsiales bacterium]MCP5361693.1 hypothetical protein [Hyphomicrobiales bacterium]
MLNKMLNRLLATHFRESPEGNRLDRLEQDVWRRIHVTTADAALPWQDKMLLAFSVPRFQLASLAIALIVGISLSPAIPLGNAVRADRAVPDMQMFTVHAPYLTANLIERNE